MEYYPVFLDLRGRRVVVLGGNALAHEKAEGLLRAGACATVIAPSLVPALAALVAEREIPYQARAYKEGDLEGAFLAISAGGDKEHNARVAAEAYARNIPLNVVDDPPHCSFIAPSILRRGDLAIAISTSGKAPAVAVRLRQQLEQQIGNEYAELLEIAGTLRAPLAARYPDFEIRKQLWYELVDSNVLELLRRGEQNAARVRIGEIMGIPVGEAQLA